MKDLGVVVCRRKTENKPCMVRQAISLGRPEDWEQGIGRRKKDGTVLHGWDKEKQEVNHHHAMQKMGILKKATFTMHSRRWESWRQQSATKDNEDRDIIWAVWDLLNLQLPQETGYKQKEERCKSGTMHSTQQPDYRIFGKGRLHARTRNKHQDPSYKKQKTNKLAMYLFHLRRNIEFLSESKNAITLRYLVTFSSAYSSRKSNSKQDLWKTKIIHI